MANRGGIIFGLCALVRWLDKLPIINLVAVGVFLWIVPTILIFIHMTITPPWSAPGIPLIVLGITTSIMRGCWLAGTALWIFCAWRGFRNLVNRQPSSRDAVNSAAPNPNVTPESD